MLCSGKLLLSPVFLSVFVGVYKPTLLSLLSPFVIVLYFLTHLLFLTSLFLPTQHSVSQFAWRVIFFVLPSIVFPHRLCLPSQTVYILFFIGSYLRLCIFCHIFHIIFLIHSPLIVGFLLAVIKFLCFSLLFLSVSFTDSNYISICHFSPGVCFHNPGFHSQ